MLVKDKVIVITGGASGCGLSCAVEFLRHDAKGVTIADIDATKGNEAVAKIRAIFGFEKAIYVETNVVDKKDFENAFQVTVEVFSQVDILVNSAAYGNEHFWENTVDVNLKGTINGCILGIDHYLPKYRSGAEGIIINISSMLAITGLAGAPAYAASKLAIIGLGNCFGAESHYLTAKVKVLTVCPGIIKTGTAEDPVIYTASHRYSELLMAEIAETNHHSARNVAKAVNVILSEGNNGSIWTISGHQVIEVKYPKLQELLSDNRISLCNC